MKTFAHPLRTCAHDFCQGICEATFGTYDFRVTSLATPLQIEGHCHGVRYYFRERHDCWRIELTGKDTEGNVISEGKTPDLLPGDYLTWAIKVIMSEMDAYIWEEA